MMNAGSTFFQKSCHRRIIAERLQQFYARLANWQHRDAHTLFRNFLGGLYHQPQRINPEREGLAYLPGSNSNMVNLHTTKSRASRVQSLRSQTHRAPFCFDSRLETQDSAL